MTRGRRAANGVGSVYRRSSTGVWVCAVMVNGKRMTRTGRTRAEVEAKRVELLGRRDAGTLVPGRMPTVGQWLDAWLETVIRPNRAMWTARGYSVLVENHIKPVLGKVRLDSLKPVQVRQWQTRMSKKVNPRTGRPYSGKTVAYARQVLRTGLQQAVNEGMLARNPVDVVDGPRVEGHDVAVLKPDEAMAFRRVVVGDRLEALWILAFALGLRQGELLGLRWDDVDLVGGVIEVRQQLQRVEGKLGLVALKTRRSRRRVRLPVFVAQALEDHHERQRSEGYANLMRLVFTNEVGQPIDARQLLRRFKRLLRRAGLADRPFHALRHSAATFLLLQHVEMKVVSEILGHSNLATTSDRYSHVLDEMMRDAAARLDDLWGQAR